MTENRNKQKVPANRSKTDQRRDAVVEALRISLEEAEETLRAIRNNEIDALVIDGPQGQQVFTLQGAEQPYRILMETMREGAITVAPNGTILYCNSHFSEMLIPLNNIIGASIHDFISKGQSFKLTLKECGKQRAWRQDSGFRFRRFAHI